MRIRDGVQTCALPISRRLTTLSIDTDRGRSFDQLAALVEMAAAVGLETQLEFGPCMGIADLPTALAAIHHVARPELRLLIDTMHFIRSGATVADLRAVDPQRSEEHTSELQSLMRISYAVFCLKKKKKHHI